MSLLSNQVYRGAVALNNIGVDLLERKCYGQALVTIVDATVAMKTALRNPGNASLTPNDTIHVAEMVERANKRRSRPSPMERQTSLDMLNQADNILYPIRIGDVHADLRCPSNLSDPDVQGAIVLYNFALANLCVAQTSHHTNVRETKLKHASFLFELCNSILEQRAAETEDKLTFRQLACMNVAVLSGLLRTVSSESIFTEKTKALYAQLYTMRSAIKDLDDYLDEYTSGIRSAAAA
jgi:hypothetical protein